MQEAINYGGYQYENEEVGRDSGPLTSKDHFFSRRLFEIHQSLASPHRSLAALTGTVAMLPPRGDASPAPAERTCEPSAAAASPGDLGPFCSVS